MFQNPKLPKLKGMNNNYTWKVELEIYCTIGFCRTTEWSVSRTDFFTKILSDLKHSNKKNVSKSNFEPLNKPLMGMSITWYFHGIPKTTNFAIFTIDTLDFDLSKSFVNFYFNTRMSKSETARILKFTLNVFQFMFVLYVWRLINLPHSCVMRYVLIYGKQNQFHHVLTVWSATRIGVRQYDDARLITLV